MFGGVCGGKPPIFCSITRTALTLDFSWEKLVFTKIELEIVIKRFDFLKEGCLLSRIFFKLCETQSSFISLPSASKCFVIAS